MLDGVNGPSILKSSDDQPISYRQVHNSIYFRRQQDGTTGFFHNYLKCPKQPLTRILNIRYIWIEHNFQQD